MLSPFKVLIKVALKSLGGVLLGCHVAPKHGIAIKIITSTAMINNLKYLISKTPSGLYLTVLPGWVNSKRRPQDLFDFKNRVRVYYEIITIN